LAPTRLSPAPPARVDNRNTWGGGGGGVAQGTAGGQEKALVQRPGAGGEQRVG
jgi:hypothetical protein